MNSDLYSPILAKSDFIIKTFSTQALPLDHGWFQTVHPDWVCCPQCNRSYPKDPRYWWWRNKEKGYLWLDACRDCKCKTKRRVKDKKRVH
jgi:hypothetical protein